jgi:NADH:ubiquinone oxidoreductase subunit E
MNHMPHIVICMGSSCFSRGNEENLAVLEDYLARHDLTAKVDLAGSRCEGACTEGPNLTIDGKRYQHVDRETLLDLLAETFHPTGGTRP